MEAKQRELETARARVQQLEAELARELASRQSQAGGYYAAYYATAGFVLGIFGAATSLLVNVVGSVAVGKQPLELIRVYLTFPMGERALEYNAIDNGVALAIGCCLYLGTGMLLGIPFHLVLSRWTGDSGLIARLMLASLLAVGVWLISFYGILSWLQPLILDGDWIVQQIPPWVAALTHLVFGWTMALVYPLGLYRPYRVMTERT